MRTILKLSILCMTLFISCSSVKNVYLENDRYFITVKDAKWKLSIPKYNFTLVDDNTNDGDAYYLFDDNKNELIIVFDIEKLEKRKDAIDCREDFVNNPTGAPFFEISKKFLRYEIGEASCLEYYVSKYEGQEINQNTITAVFAKDMYSIRVHVSKTSFQKEYREKMLDIVRSISFSDKVKQ